MVPNSRLRFRPQVEVLEDRALPNNFFSGADGFGVNPLDKHKDDDQQIFRAVNALNAQQNPAVMPVQSHPFGASYAEWSARWWEYALSIPADKSPFLDGTGANFAYGQSGHVWFLSGTIGFTFDPNGPPPPSNPATADRTVSVPAGTALFFPILNTEWDNLVPGGPNTTFTVDQLRAIAKSNIDLAQDLQAQIDGVPVTNLADFRVTSPVFSYHLPANNLPAYLTGVPIPEQTVSPAVGDGYYLMVHPLSVGQHTIHFAGDFGPGNFALDVTYHVTVTPGK